MAQISGLTPVDSLSTSDLLMVNQGFVSGLNTGVEKRASLSQLYDFINDKQRMEYKNLYSTWSGYYPKAFGIAELVFKDEIPVDNKGAMLRIDLIASPWYANKNNKFLVTSSIAINLRYGPAQSGEDTGTKWRGGILHNTVMADDHSSYLNDICIGAISNQANNTGYKVLIYVGMPENKGNYCTAVYGVTGRLSPELTLNILDLTDDNVYYSDNSNDGIILPEGYPTASYNICEEKLLPRTPVTVYTDSLPPSPDANTVYLVP